MSVQLYVGLLILEVSVPVSMGRVPACGFPNCTFSVAMVMRMGIGGALPILVVSADH